MSSNHYNTPDLIDRLLTGLCQCQAITELLALQLGDGPFAGAWDALLRLLDELIALADTEPENGQA